MRITYNSESAGEITPVEAWKLIGKRKIYAYDEELKKDYRIFSKLDLRDAIKAEHVLYVINE